MQFPPFAHRTVGVALSAALLAPASARARREHAREVEGSSERDLGAAGRVWSALKRALRARG